MHPLPSAGDSVSIRTELRPGDLGAIVHLHGVIYAQERGWDVSFEAYVAGPLAQFVLAPSPRQQLWIAENGRRMVGCIAIVPVTLTSAQLRWFLVEPSVRGLGLGSRLLDEAVRFCHNASYTDIVLWTERSLSAAAYLYCKAGFRKVEEKAGKMWGADVVEEKYVLNLPPTNSQPS